MEIWVSYAEFRHLSFTTLLSYLFPEREIYARVPHFSRTGFKSAAHLGGRECDSCVGMMGGHRLTDMGPATTSQGGSGVFI